MDKDLQDQLEFEIWQQTGDLLRETVKAALPVSMAVREAALELPALAADEEYGRIWYEPNEKVAFINFPPFQPHGDAALWCDTLEDIDGINIADASAGADVVPPDFGKRPWVLIKNAATVSDVAGPVAQAAGWKTGPLNAWMGGPNTLASTLTSGLMGAGLGYGLGWLGEQFLPEEHFEPKRLRRATALLGGLGAGVPTLWWGLRGGFGKHLPDFQPTPASPLVKPAGVIARARRDLQPWLDKRGQFGAIGGLLADPYQEFGGQMAQHKTQGGAGAFIPRIPVDAFNRAIWSDPFTEPRIRAAASGLVEAAGVASGSSVVSPADIARVGAGMGSGWVSGLVVGKALGALAGLKPETQKTLQRAGMWAGFLNSVVPRIFQ